MLCAVIALTWLGAVPPGHWAHPAVERLVADGIIVLDADGGYRGNDRVTRAELGGFVYRLLAAHSDQAETLAADAILVERVWGRRFADVPAGHWAEEAVYALVDKGILEGYPGPSRASEAPLKAGIIAAVERCLQLLDAPSGDLVEGDPRGDLALNRPMTRYQLAALLDRATRRLGQ